MPTKEIHAAFDAFLYASGVIKTKQDYYTLIHTKMDGAKGHRSSPEHSDPRYLIDKLASDARRSDFGGRELTDCLRVWWGHIMLDEEVGAGNIDSNTTIDEFVRALSLMRRRGCDTVKYHL
jgi:hypothetical protein